MPTRLDIHTTVDASPEELFDLMADPETENDWNPDAREVRRIDDGELGAGAKWEGRYRGMGTMHITLDDYQRPKRLVFSVAGSRLDMHWTFTLAPDGSATELTAVAEVEPRGPMRLMSPLLGPMMRRTFSRRPDQLAEGVARRRYVSTS